MGSSILNWSIVVAFYLPFCSKVVGLATTQTADEPTQSALPGLWLAAEWIGEATNRKQEYVTSSLPYSL
jgi:hypothetical protein